ncbi:phosphatidate cytidylyltransferase [Candidatus Pelagibacter sp. HIMB1485]|uniref:phosphatidate cytidylyltransferase n=1 Tax=Candidatus Pelagibacter sp. HIMB1485 TaxID=3415415 RepID=UPI003F86162D
METELKKRILSSIILTPIVIFFIIHGSFLFILLLITSFCIALYEWHMISKHKTYNFFGFIFLNLSFYSIYKIRINEDGSYENFLFILLICVLTDIGGYIFGKTIKGPKLTSYSPNKTIAGLIGSYFLALSLVPLLIFLNQVDQDHTLLITLYIILISTVSQIGDIVVSFFKRKSKKKDTGNLIPGHGGLLDRIDGMIFAFPIAYLISFFNLFDKI